MIKLKELQLTDFTFNNNVYTYRNADGIFIINIIIEKNIIAWRINYLIPENVAHKLTDGEEWKYYDENDKDRLINDAIIKINKSLKEHYEAFEKICLSFECWFDIIKNY